MATRRITRRKTVLLFATSCIFVAVLASTCAAEQAASLSLRPLLLAEPLQRLRALSKLSDDDGNDNLTRPFGGPAHARAAEEIRKWFEDAGLEKVKLDAVGNVRGALSFGESEKEEEEEDASVLLLGSHYDTVRGAGIYDGALGIVAAVAAVKAASRRIAAAELEAAGTRKEKKPSRRKTVEVVAFSDEEGLRFGTTFLGSSALKGTLLGSGALDSAVDSDGVTLRDALLELKEKERKKKESSTSSSPPSSSSLDEDVAACARSSTPSSPSSSTSSSASSSSSSSSSRSLSRYRGYVEAHMEQGPTLEAEGARLSAVSGISGQTRLGVSLRGAAGHAGTVPMNAGESGGGIHRRDAAAGAAEVVVSVERICQGMSEEKRRRGGIIARATAAALGRALRAARAAAGSGSRAAASCFSLPPLFLREALERTKSSLLSPPPPPPPEHLVCTVGRLLLKPNAPNVIAGSAELVVDVRSSSDAARARALASIGGAIAGACSKRSLECETETIHEARASAADPGLTAAVERAARASEATFLSLRQGGGDDDDDEGEEENTPTPHHVARARASGAGHDALALAAAPLPLPWAMLFVRDVKGVSHSKDERVRDGDVAAAAAALYEVVVEHLGL